MAKASDFEGKKPEELFYFVDYSPEEAERIGYSNYSYWGSVIQNFFKQKVAVFCLILFLALTVFSFCSHYTTLILILVRYTTTWAVTTGARCGTPPRFPREHRGRDLWPDWGIAQSGPLLHLSCTT